MLVNVVHAHQGTAKAKHIYQLLCRFAVPWIIDPVPGLIVIRHVGEILLGPDQLLNLVSALVLLWRVLNLLLAGRATFGDGIEKIESFCRVGQTTSQ